MCGFQTAARQRNGGRLGLRRVWANGRIGGTRMSSRHRKRNGRQRNGPTEKWRAVGSTPCVGEWTDWRNENEQQASKKEVAPRPFARRRGWRCQVHRARPTRCHELPLRSARPRSARNRLSRVWVRSSWGRAQTVRMLYIASHDAARKAQCRNLFLGGSFDACCSFSSLQSVHSPY